MNWVLALVSGVLFALAFPDAAIGWLAFVALAPLVIAVVRAGRARTAFFLGWISQTAAWLMMVPWVVRVMSHYGGLPYATGVLLLVAMAGYLGLYGGAFALIVHALRLNERFGKWLLVPLAWVAVEYARTYLLTGFPWNLVAAAVIDSTPLIQIARFAGPYFVGFLLLLPSTLAAWLVTQKTSGPVRVIAIGSVAIVVFVWWTTGYVASRVRGVVAPKASSVAALLQPNISQEMRWDEQNLLAIYGRMMEMTQGAIDGGARVVIWPESTVPLSYSSTSFFREAIESVSKQHGADVILGSVAEDPQQPARLWNAAFLVSGGATAGRYDKIRLVPFGEYVPLRKMLFFAEKLVRAVGEFEFGTNDRPLRGRFAYGPAICYEIVFPRIAATQVKNGAEVLVTITNDAWYDGTSAPRQHLNQARLRAVETDRYLLRAATTGISAVVDPAGRIVEELPMGREGVIFARFEPRTTTTPYVRYGDWFAWLASAIVVAGIAVGRIPLRTRQ